MMPRTAAAWGVVAMPGAAIAYIVTVLIFVGLDLVWLTWVGGPAYRAALGDILLPEVRLVPALLFYLVYPLGLAMFAVVPHIGGSSVAEAAIGGALFGFFTYATYDLTNLATLKNWTIGVAAMDIAWGCVLGAVAAAAAVAVTRAIGSQFGVGG